MEQTTNYQLKKPAGNESAKIVDINDNMDVIDGLIKALQDAKASNTDLTSLRNSVTQHLEQKTTQYVAAVRSANVLGTQKISLPFKPTSIQLLSNVASQSKVFSNGFWAEEGQGCIFCNDQGVMSQWSGNLGVISINNSVLVCKVLSTEFDGFTIEWSISSGTVFTGDIRLKFLVTTHGNEVV